MESAWRETERNIHPLCCHSLASVASTGGAWDENLVPHQTGYLRQLRGFSQGSLKTIVIYIYSHINESSMITGNKKITRNHCAPATHLWLPFDTLDHLEEGRPTELHLKQKLYRDDRSLSEQVFWQIRLRNKTLCPNRCC